MILLKMFRYFFRLESRRSFLPRARPTSQSRSLELRATSHGLSQSLATLNHFNVRNRGLTVKCKNNLTVSLNTR